MINTNGKKSQNECECKEFTEDPYYDTKYECVDCRAVYFYNYLKRVLIPEDRGKREVRV